MVELLRRIDADCIIRAGLLPSLTETETIVAGKSYDRLMTSQLHCGRVKYRAAEPDRGQSISSHYRIRSRANVKQAGAWLRRN